MSVLLFCVLTYFFSIINLVTSCDDKRITVLSAFIALGGLLLHFEYRWLLCLPVWGVVKLSSKE